jgi:hypothetical protein
MGREASARDGFGATRTLPVAASADTMLLYTDEPRVASEYGNISRRRQPRLIIKLLIQRRGRVSLMNPGR